MCYSSEASWMRRHGFGDRPPLRSSSGLHDPRLRFAKGRQVWTKASGLVGRGREGQRSRQVLFLEGSRGFDENREYTRITRHAELHKPCLSAHRAHQPIQRENVSRQPPPVLRAIAYRYLAVALRLRHCNTATSAISPVGLAAPRNTRCARSYYLIQQQQIQKQLYKEQQT